MVAYDPLESSLQDSRPVELYSFALGVDEFRYTSSAAEEVDTVGTVYSPIPISRSAITQGQDASSRTLTITMPANTDFARQYVNVVPGQKATVSILRLQRDEAPFITQVLIFKGVVLSARYPDDGQNCELAIRSIESAGNQNTPRYGFSGLCNHVLYGPGCGVDPAAHNFIGPVSAATGNTITVTGAGASGKDFLGGFCRPTGVSDFRLITAVSGDVLTLLLPFSVNVVGMSMQCFAGCDRKVDGDCANVFDNVLNFGGFAWNPELNPFEKLIV